MVTKLRLIRNGNQCRKYKHAAVAAGFFFVAMAFLVVYKPQSLAVPNFGFRASIANPDSGSNMVNGEDDHARNSLASGRNDDKEEAFSENYYISDSKKESGREFKDTMLNQETMHVELPIASNSTAPMQLAAGEAIRRRKPLCDVSDPRVDICEMSGDIRIAGNSSSILFIEPEAAARPPEQWRVRPYPRKGDDTCLGGVRQFAVVSARSDGAPQCTVDHGDVPAVVFSVGGYTGNLFHDFTDLLVPLFVTAGPFHGKIQFVVADWKSWWINKYLVVFRKLTNYQLMDLEQQSAGQVHCFKQVVVGLRAHKEFLIDPARSPNRYTMVDFKRFMRIAFSLERDALNNATDGGHLPPRRKPRLMLIARKQSRAFTNVPEIVAMAEELGFEVMVAEADAGSDLARFAGVVNSCDVMVGVHGAGLTNMVFLPANATVVQVVPWGALEWLAMLDFGNPAKAMGLHYVQYSIGIEESTLRERYPRGHAVFTDPMSFHRRGFAVVRSTFMVRQDVKLDVKRFRELLGKEVGHMIQ